MREGSVRVRVRKEIVLGLEVNRLQDSGSKLAALQPIIGWLASASH